MDSREAPPGSLPEIPAGNGMKWKAIWGMTDEFWRESIHDIWEPYNRTWLGRPPSFFRTSDVRIADHKMLLSARRDQPDSVPSEELRNRLIRSSKETSKVNATKAWDERTPLYRDFSASFVRTTHKQKYGYFEIYCKLADCDISSAFWLNCNERNENPKGTWWTEIDVFEYSTSSQKFEHGRIKNEAMRVNTNRHVHINGDNPDAEPDRKGIYWPETEDLSKRPHKFALDWTPEYIRWYFDGKLIRDEKNEFFHRALHLQLDRETFPNWFGLPRANGNEKLPNDFEVYYVRSWERVRS